MNTITDKTKSQYTKKSIGFIARAYKEALHEGHSVANAPETHKIGESEVQGLSLLNTSIWACNKWAPNVLQSSWKFYRASLSYTANDYFNANKLSEKNFTRIKSVLSKTTGKPKGDSSYNTSAQKQKRLPEEDLVKIVEKLSKSKSIWAIPTILWLKSGTLTGLRPIEWKTAKLSDDNESIKVKNAKHTNGRGNGDFRTLSLKHLTDKDKRTIQAHIKVSITFSATEEEWNYYYLGCSNLLRNKCRQIFKKRKKFPTLYSPRHQYSANLKASGCKPNQIAALMGHSSDLTAQISYGRKTSGKKGVMPEIDESELNSVKKHSKTVNTFTFSKKQGPDLPNPIK